MNPFFFFRYAATLFLALASKWLVGSSISRKCPSLRKRAASKTYLFGRGIDYEIINYCLEKELIIESLPYHNVVFIGYDESNKPKYAAYRATNQSRLMGDCTGSKKQYSFRLTAENTGEVHLFECAIDLLSYATLMKLEGKNWRQLNLVSLAGVYSPKQNIGDSKVPVTVRDLLEKDKSIKRIILHLDNDIRCLRL